MNTAQRLLLGSCLSVAMAAAPAAGSSAPVTPAASAVATSELTASKTASYTASNILDGQQATAWVEGVRGVGIGQSIDIDLGESAQLRGAKKISGVIYAGYQKSTASYQNNSRPTLLHLELFANDHAIGTSKVRVLDAVASQTSPTEFEIPVAALPPQGRVRLRVTISGAQAGRKWQDTAISEVRCDFVGGNPHGVREALQPFSRAVNAMNAPGISAFTSLPVQDVLNGFTNEYTEETSCGLDDLRVLSETTVEVPANSGEDANYYARFRFNGTSWRLEQFSHWWHRGFEEN